MRNFALIFFLFTTLFAIQSVRAESTHDMCGMNVTTDKSGETAVTCRSCKTSESYAMAGAAAIKNSDLNDIIVRSPDKKTEFVVTLSTAYKNASTTFGGGVGVTGHMTHNIPDPSATTVAARNTRGYVPGGSWRTEAVSNKAIARKCTNLVKEAAEAIAQNIHNTESVNRIEGESIEKYLQRAWLNGVKITNGGGGRTGRSWSCQADDEGNCKTQGVPRYHH
jgi:hypothetical protein